MSEIPALVTLIAIVFAVNLMPAFGPPTWIIIAFFGLTSTLPLPAIVLVGAAVAASGRLLLALAFRWLGNRVPSRMRENLEAARTLFERKRRNAVLGLALFALSPVPSAQLFEAAGLTRIPLVKFTLAFFAGRVVSYAIYAGTAHQLKESSLADQLGSFFSDPVALVFELVMIAALIGLIRMPWKRILEKGRDAEAHDDGLK